MLAISANEGLGSGIIHAPRDLKIFTSWRMVEPSNGHRGHNSSSGHDERYRRNGFQEDDGTINENLTGLEWSKLLVYGETLMPIYAFQGPSMQYQARGGASAAFAPS